MERVFSVVKRVFGNNQGRPVLGETLETAIMAQKDLKWESNLDLTRPDGPPPQEDEPAAPAPPAQEDEPAQPAVPHQEAFSDEQSQEIEAFIAQ